MLCSLETLTELCEKHPRTVHLRVNRKSYLPIGSSVLSVKGGPMQFQGTQWLVPRAHSGNPKTGSERYLRRSRVRNSWSTSKKLVKVYAYLGAMPQVGKRSRRGGGGLWKAWEGCIYFYHVSPWSPRQRLNPLEACSLLRCYISFLSLLSLTKNVLSGRLELRSQNGPHKAKTQEVFLPRNSNVANLFSYFFQLLEGTSFFGLWPHCPPLKSVMVRQAFFTSHLSDTDSPASLFHIIRILVITVGLLGQVTTISTSQGQLVSNPSITLIPL